MWSYFRAQTQWVEHEFSTVHYFSLQWHHNGCDSVSNHQPQHCLLNRLFRRSSTETTKLRGTCLCEGNSQVTSEFPAQKASNAENVSIWWRHHVFLFCTSIHLPLDFIPGFPVVKLAIRRTCDEPLSEQMMNQFTDTYQLRSAVPEAGIKGRGK